MARTAQCTLAAVLCLAAHAAHAAHAVRDARLDDSSDFFQVTTRLHEDVQAEVQVQAQVQVQDQGQGQGQDQGQDGQKPSPSVSVNLRESMEKLQQLAQSGVARVQQLKQNSSQRLQQLKQDWEQHVQRRIAELDQEKAAKQQRLALAEAERVAKEEATNAEAARRAEADALATAQKVAADEEAAESQLREKERALEAQKSVAAAAAAEAAQVMKRREEERQEEELAAKRHKFGKELNVTVRSVLGDLNTTLWSATRLQTVTKSLVSKLELKLEKGEDANFSLTLNGQAVDPMTTPKEVGMVDNDVVLVSGPALDRRHEEDLRKQAWWAEMEAEAAVRAELKRKADARRATAVAAVRRTRQQKRDGRMNLHFVHEEAGVLKERMDLAVRSSHWLQGGMDLVIKRLGLDAEKARFLLPADRRFIVGKDTPDSLGLESNATIIVKTPWHKPGDSVKS